VACVFVLNGYVMPSDFGNDKGDKLLGIEVFYADRALETFGRDGSGWFWRSRRRGFSPAGLLLAHLLRAIHPYRHAENSPAPISLWRK
jgi:hypothetical protein